MAQTHLRTRTLLERLVQSSEEVKNAINKKDKSINIPPLWRLEYYLKRNITNDEVLASLKDIWKNICDKEIKDIILAYQAGSLHFIDVMEELSDFVNAYVLEKGINFNSWIPSLSSANFLLAKFNVCQISFVSKLYAGGNGFT